MRPALCALVYLSLQIAAARSTPAPAAKPTRRPPANTLTPTVTPTSIPATPTLTPTPWTFDPIARSLPAEYQGDSIKPLFAIPSKDEFETTAQYQTRLASAAPPIGAIKVFRIPSARAVYDADRQVLKVQIASGDTYDGFEKSSLASLEVLREESGKREYEGSNAFGAKIMVSASTNRLYKLVFDSRRATGQRYSVLGDMFQTLELSMGVDDARTLKPRVGVIAVCRLKARPAPKFPIPSASEGPTATGFNSTKPTRDFPYDISTYYYALPVDILGLWVFDNPTGRVLGKFDSSGALNESAVPSAKPASAPASASAPLSFSTISPSAKVLIARTADDIKPCSYLTTVYEAEPCPDGVPERSERCLAWRAIRAGGNGILRSTNGLLIYRCPEPKP